LRAAFFDMDRTILRVNSATLWMKFLRRRGEISRWQLARAFGWLLQYKLAILDMDTVSKRLVADLEGDAERDMVDKCARWYTDEILPTISSQARRAIEERRAAGDRIVLLTSATPYIARPLAETLRLDEILCSELEVTGGLFTGRVVEPICYGAGKVAHAERYAARHQVDLAKSSFYTDSYSDLPMLQRVGVPVVVNPDPRLHRLARRRGWPVHDWSTEDTADA
jgi:HAD superfamily hydrolase (TIGR01490 family)